MSTELSSKEIDCRLPVWQAMSDLFLDTELQEFQYKYIAKVIVASEFTAQEIHYILWNEVFPALADNLRIVSGEWQMFQDEWLVKRIMNVLSKKESSLGFFGLISVKATRNIIVEAWEEVCKYMPPEYK